MMSPNRTISAALGLVPLVAAAPVWADNAAIPYNKRAAFKSAFNTIPVAQRDKLILEVAIVHSDQKDHSPIKAWVDAGGKHIDIPPAEDGALQLPDRPDWVSQNVLVQTDQRKHTLGIGLDMVVTPFPGRTIPVKHLRDAVQQGNDAMRAGARSMRGFLAMLAAPSSKSVSIDLVTCSGCTAAVTGGADSAETSTFWYSCHSVETLKSNANGSVDLSAAPKRIGLFGD